MMYQSTMTSKGQVLVPKDIRTKVGFSLRGGVTFTLRDNGGEQEVILKPQKSIMSLAGKFKPRKNKSIDAVRSRDYMNAHYERV